MYAGIDCGTQGSKVVIYDPQQGKCIGTGYREHELISRADGTREQHPDWWISAIVDAFREALEESGINPQDIRGIGVSGQQHGLVVLDQNDKVIRPAKLWCDTSTATENEALVEAIGGKMATIDSIGQTIATGYTVSKLLWLKQYEAQNYAQIKSILLPHDYINFWLTGEKTAEFGDASGTGFFDTHQRGWSDQVLGLVDDNIDLSEMLPRLISAQEPAGSLSHSAAAALGLPAGILVSSGGGDNMMGAIGTGNVKEGILTMSLGTSGTVYAQMNQPSQDNTGLIAGFCSSTNAWLPLICTMNVTNVTSVVQTAFGIELEVFNQHLKETAIGADGLVMLPFLNGERTPDLPESTGSLLGIRPDNFNAANLCRAAVEGVSFGLRYGLDLLENSGQQVNAIRLIGGGSKSKQWRQIIADMMNKPVVVPAESEAAALGAALQAEWCHAGQMNNADSLEDICSRGVLMQSGSDCVPDVQNTESYQQAYDHYTNIKHHMYPSL